MGLLRKRLMRILLLFLVLLLIPVGVRFARGYRVISLLRDAIRKQESVMDLRIHTAQLDATLHLSWDTVDGARYYTVEAGEEKLYFHKNAVCFETGTGYDLSALIDESEYAQWADWKSILLLDIKKYGDKWSLSIPEGALSGDQKVRESLTVTLYETDGTLNALAVSFEGFQLRMEHLDQEPDSVPTEILMVMGAGDFPDIRTLKPLISACTHLAKADSVLADAVIRANCGPFSVEESGQFRYDPEGLFFGRDDRWISLTPDVTDRNQLLLGLGWVLLRDGQWTQEESCGYLRMRIPSDAVTAALHAILPELEELEIRLEDGMLTAEIRDDRLQEVELTCTGALPFLVTAFPLSIQVQISISI